VRSEGSAEIGDENWLSVQQAAALLPPGRGGRPVSKTTVVGWIETGAPDPDGKMVKLEAVRLGSRWVTSREALARFMARLTRFSHWGYRKRLLSLA
jgi:hypothetical protein